MILKSPEHLKRYVFTREDMDLINSGDGNELRQRKISQRELSRRIGASASLISHLTSGRNEKCSEVLATRIAEVLGLPVTDLFDVEAVERKPMPHLMPAPETSVKVKGVRGKRPHGWDTADGFGKEFEPVLAHGPDAYTAQGDLNVWTVWQKGVGVTFVIDADAARSFTLEEAIEYRDALTRVITKVEKAVKK